MSGCRGNLPNTLVLHRCSDTTVADETSFRPTGRLRLGHHCCTFTCPAAWVTGRFLKGGSLWRGRAHTQVQASPNSRGLKVQFGQSAALTHSCDSWLMMAAANLLHSPYILGSGVRWCIWIKLFLETVWIHTYFIFSRIDGIPLNINGVFCT